MRRRKILLVLCLMISPLLALADDPGEPCDGSEPYDNNCPLDSWVYLLVLTPVVITFTAVFLKSQIIKEPQKNTDDNLTSFNPLTNKTATDAEKHKKAA